MNKYRITGIESKIKDFDTFLYHWNNESDFILNGYADYGEVHMSNGFINKNDYSLMYDAFKHSNIEVITDKDTYLISSDLLYI